MHSYVSGLPLLLLNNIVSNNYLTSNNDPLPRQSVNLSTLYEPYQLLVPVDHFHNDSRYEPHSNDLFNLTYYFDATYYEPGGPVIIFQGGEDTITSRFAILQKGIIAQIAQVTRGIAVLLEHRYYGTSFPVADLSTQNLRFLTTDQALADQAYFQNNIVFPGFESINLTAPGTAHINYGGSYGGVFVAFMRKLYPQSTWGAISSSGVTEAYYDFWQYYEPIRQYGPKHCIETHTKLINIADNILLGSNATLKSQLRAAFNASEFTHDDDFANTLGDAMSDWQGRNWDPEENDPGFDAYCGNISAHETLHEYKGKVPVRSTLRSLISAGGWANESDHLIIPMSNFVGWYKTTITASCDTTLDECHGNNNATATKYTDRSLGNYQALSWAYQYCTQWGYLPSGSSVPKDLLPLVSRLVTTEYLAQICKFAFNITTPSNITEINKYGGYNLTYPRLAHIGGEADPWRPVTPLADAPLDGSGDLINRTSTLSEPLYVIKNGVHHWDENGVFGNQTNATFPPQGVKEAQAIIVYAASQWMAQWRVWCANEGKGICNNIE